MTVKCEICAKCGLANHINTVHEGKKLSFKCKDCSALYTTKAGLTRHNASNHVGDKPFKCEICDAGYSIKGELRTHISSAHEKNKPYKCEFCDAKYARKWGLTLHVSSIHDELKLFTLRCQLNE